MKLEEKFIFKSRLKLICFIFIAIGILTFVYGFISNPKATWGNYLINNIYFVSLSLGAAFFMAVQSVTQSGWSSGFKRISEAIQSFIPISFILFLLLAFGMHSLYHWSDTHAIAEDPLLQHKFPYLNIPFFFIRMILFFISWIIFTRILRKFSLKEDEIGGLQFFTKSELYSKIFIFVLAISFTLSIFDWLMSIDPHWFSTVFAFKYFVSGFLHASVIIMLIIIFLNRNGYLSFLTKSHLHDFSRYIFVLSMAWGYLWFSQYMIIWYSNIPEETSYYFPRLKGEFKIVFFLEVILNWAIPFVVLMPRFTSRNTLVVTIVGILLIVGHWVEIYTAVMPGVTGNFNIGFIEIGTFLGFIGLFSFIVLTVLSKQNLIPINHPYLEESLKHNY